MNREEIDVLWFKAMEQAIRQEEMNTRYHFAALIAAEEREACAKVCDDLAEGEPAYDNAAIAAHVIRKRARARGGE